MITRTRYMHDYYIRNKHRKKYTYQKKGVMKKLSETQYTILVLVRQGYQIFQYCDKYQYWSKGLTYLVNTASVQCLITSGHMKLDGHMLVQTEKGQNHKQGATRSVDALKRKTHVN